MCYVLGNDLVYDSRFEPCKGRPTNRAHEEYGYCQAGTSGTLLDDGSMVLGTPGPYTWRGTIFVISLESEFLKRDKTNYYSPHQDQDSPVDKYSYLGMAVSGGRYYGHTMSFAAGAPRSNDHGQVVIFSKNTDTVMREEFTLDGEQFASSFGYELATGDFNGDNQDDLVVAAPFYFSKTEGGAVYVYQNKNFGFSQNYSLKLTGKLESRFGIALAYLGDINQDGYGDLAVGAPYEDDGVVYIYLGSSNGLSTEPAQIITSKSLGQVTKRIKTFGSSLSGGVDLDDNSYPDLVIGAYQSAVTVALLSRPITKIKTSVEIGLLDIDPEKQGCPADVSTNLTCFSITACCSIQPYSSTRNLDLTYIIEAETYNNLKKFSRVFFGPDFNKKSNIIRKNISVTPNDVMNCHEEIVYIKENTKDIQTPIKFRLNYIIVEPTLPRSGLISLNPILDKTQADRTFIVSFQKDCGSNDICESQLDVFAGFELKKEKNYYKLELGESVEIKLQINVTNSNDSAYEAQLFVKHSSAVKYIASGKSFIICKPFNTTLISCNLGNPFGRGSAESITLRFDPIGLAEETDPITSFVVFANSTSNQSIPRADTVLLVKAVKRAELSIKGAARPQQSFYGGEIKDEKSIKFLEDIGTAINHTYEIFNDGPWKSLQSNIIISFPHKLRKIDGTVKELFYLEESAKIEVSGELYGQCITTGIVNRLKLDKREHFNPLVDMIREDNPKYLSNRTESSEYSSKYSSSNFNRVRRSSDIDLDRPVSLVDRKKENSVRLDCQSDLVECITFTCIVYEIPKFSVVYIKIAGRLWVSTLSTEYPKVDLVKIVSDGKIKLLQGSGAQENTQDDYISVESRAYPELLDQTGDSSVPIWIIIVSIIFGLLLLALFTFILWKIGFFKRRRIDPTLSANLKKEEENKPFIAN